MRRELISGLVSSRTRILWIGAIGALLVVGVPPLMVTTSAQRNEYYQVVQRRDVTEVVLVVGDLSATSSTIVKCPVVGSDTRLLWIVEDGTYVEEGDDLARLDTTGFVADLNRADAELIGAQATLEVARQVRLVEEVQARSSFDSARMKAETARLRIRGVEWGEGPQRLATLESEYQKSWNEAERWRAYISDLGRMETKGIDVMGELVGARRKFDELSDKTNAAKSQLESYRDYAYPMALEAAKLELNDALAEVSRTEKVIAFVVAKTEADIRRAESVETVLSQRVAELKALIEDATIRAPSDGLVVLREVNLDGKRRKPEAGDKIYGDLPLLELPDVSMMQVHARLREIDLPRITLGQRAEIIVEASPENVFEGKLRSIGALALSEDEEMEKYFSIVVDLNGGGNRLRPGMSARVKLTATTRSAVLTVPVNYVISKGANAHVLIKSFGRVVGKPVRTGVHDDRLIEIIAGVNEGDTVVRPE